MDVVHADPKLRPGHLLRRIDLERPAHERNALVARRPRVPDPIAKRDWRLHLRRLVPDDPPGRPVLRRQQPRFPPRRIGVRRSLALRVPGTDLPVVLLPASQRPARVGDLDRPVRLDLARIPDHCRGILQRRLRADHDLVRRLHRAPPSVVHLPRQPRGGDVYAERVHPVLRTQVHRLVGLAVGRRPDRRHSNHCHRQDMGGRRTTTDSENHHRPNPFSPGRPLSAS